MGIYREMGRAVLGGAKVGSRAGRMAGDSFSSRLAEYNAGKGARRGYLGPGDPSPPPTATMDYLDYRGVASWDEVRNLDRGQFPLGALADLAKGRFRGPIGLPGQALNRHAAIVGPAGSGKTFSVLVPWMYAALVSGWSVIAVDVKGDLRDEFLDYKDAQAAGALGAKLVKWDFTDPRGSAPWDWMSELTDDARTDAALTALLGRRPESGTQDPYFYQRDRRTLRGLLRFAGATMTHVRTASDLMRVIEDDVKLDAAVRANPRAPGASDLEAALRHPQSDYPKIVSGVVTALSALDSAAVNAVTRSAASRPSINLEQSLSDHQLLIIGAALKGGDLSATLTSLMLNQLSQRMFERFGTRQRPVLLVVDEAPQIVDRVDIAQLMEVARSAGIAVIVAMQDVAQISDEDERSTILSNAATMAVLPGASPKTATEFAARLGTRFEQTVNMNFDGPRRLGQTPGQGVGTQTVPVLGSREIMQPPVGNRPAVVHVKASELGIASKPMLIDMHRG